jgi:hypothetical protein
MRIGLKSSKPQQPAMKFFSISFVCIIVIITIQSCANSNKGNNNNIRSFSKFDTASTICFTNLIKVDSLKLWKLFLYDSTLIGWNIKNATDFLAYQYDLQTNKLIRKFIKGGRGLGETLGAFSGGIKGRLFWFHDLTLNKIVIEYLSENREKGPSNLEYTQQMPFNKFYYSVQLVDTTKLLAAGLYSNQELKNSNINELDFIDIKNQTKVRGYGHFPVSPPGIPVGSWIMAHEGFVFLKPTNDKAIIAYRFMDQIKIFDLINSKSQTIKGPEGFKLEFTPINVNGVDEMQRNKNTRFGYIGGSVTNEFIYLLFSGRKENSSPSNSSSNSNNVTNIMYVFDWSGNPIKKILMCRNITCFVVSETNKIMYGFDEESGAIVKANL